MTADEYPVCPQCGERHPPETNAKLVGLIGAVLNELSQEEYTAEDIVKFACTFVHYAFGPLSPDQRDVILDVLINAMNGKVEYIHAENRSIN